MDWSNIARRTLRAKAQRQLIEAERVVHNSMMDLESHLGGADPEKNGSVPQFWLYAKSVVLVCQWCDTTLFTSPEDANLADLEKTIRGHVCETEGQGTA